MKSENSWKIEKGETCQSILILLRGEITWSKKESVVCEALFNWSIQNLLVLKYFLAYLDSSVKTTID